MKLRTPEGAQAEGKGLEFSGATLMFSAPTSVLTKLSHPVFQLAKRLLDTIGALVLLLMLSPFLPILAVVIKVDSPGGVFYQQERIGRGGKPFKLLKFRTMYPSASDMLEAIIHEDPNHKVSWEQYQKLLDDPRLTPVGQVMRRMSIDEIPQVWNVIRGEMSLVGPRPFLPEQKSHYGEAYASYVQVRPGITGLWQINGRNLTSFTERARWDEYYVRNWSFLLDVYILLRTIGVVVRGEGAY